MERIAEEIFSCLGKAKEEDMVKLWLQLYIEGHDFSQI